MKCSTGGHGRERRCPPLHHPPGEIAFPALRPSPRSTGLAPLLLVSQPPEGRAPGRQGAGGRSRSRQHSSPGPPPRGSGAPFLPSFPPGLLLFSGHVPSSSQSSPEPRVSGPVTGGACLCINGRLQGCQTEPNRSRPSLLRSAVAEPVAPSAAGCMVFALTLSVTLLYAEKRIGPMCVLPACSSHCLLLLLLLPLKLPLLLLLLLHRHRLLLLHHTH